ncbi:transcriptional regulator [Adhaeretor mobilis]|uniref:Uncharacterized protein n=1 Tax=Adhaeretor mobilis TaxID=1930276 RepID=A0A517MTG0_9BACT|nr:transcriptional regulator [Adhaeretor mobilis]QDS98142.1 hypothetical protein HG15A2_14150 [Adhaeretor mobilis]
MSTNAQPPKLDLPKLDGCRVLPPIDDGNRQATEPPTPKAKRNRKQTAGRFATLNQFIDETLATLCRGDIAVWMILYRDTRNGTARTARTDIAKRAGLSLRGVGKVLRRLEKQGLLKQVYRGGLNRGPSRYRVIPTPDDPIDNPNH